MAREDFFIISTHDDLHPKCKKFPFKDKNDQEHRSVAEAFVSVTKGFISRLTVSQVIEILAKILLAQFTQHPSTLGTTIQTTGNQKFRLKQKSVDFLPGDPKAKWNIMYGAAISLARTFYTNKLMGNRYEQSTGDVPKGAYPCLKCGGHGRVAGTGYHLAVRDPKFPGGWKYVGACFDCLPKGSQEGRGLGYISRSMARKNWVYYQHNPDKWTQVHVDLENLNLYDPDDNSLWVIKKDQVKKDQVRMDPVNVNTEVQDMEEDIPL